MQPLVAPASVVEVLPFDIPLGMPRPDGPMGHYEIPPCTAEDFWRLRALDHLWAAVGRGRLKDLAQAPPDEVAKMVTDDTALQADIVSVMQSKWTAQDVIAAPLTRPVFDQMLADGVLDVYVKLASAAAMAWILTGDKEAAVQVFSGENPGNRAARRRKSSPNTAGASVDRRASTSGTRSRKTSKPGSTKTRTPRRSNKSGDTTG